MMKLHWKSPTEFSRTFITFAWNSQKTSIMRFAQDSSLKYSTSHLHLDVLQLLISTASKQRNFVTANCSRSLTYSLLKLSDPEILPEGSLAIATQMHLLYFYYLFYYSPSPNWDLNSGMQRHLDLKSNNASDGIQTISIMKIWRMMWFSYCLLWCHRLQIDIFDGTCNFKKTQLSFGVVTVHQFLHCTCSEFERVFIETDNCNQETVPNTPQKALWF